jgi:hypothetical protein
MSKKIKSITVKKDIKLTNWGDPNVNPIECLIKDIPEAFDIEYEPELLKRPDGSLIGEPEFKKNVLFLYTDFSIKKTQFIFDDYHIILLKKGLVFLPEDKHLAEKKAKMLTKQLEIQYEIDRLNTEEGWVVDWEDYTQHKYFFCDDAYATKFRATSTVYNNYGQKVMSQTTAETILKKYTQDELKQYLNIII